MEGTTDATLRAALDYTAQGWAVIPVYGVEAGVCQCKDGGACLNSGKHPIQRGWTKGDALSAADLAAILDEYPTANLGLRTGAASGFFVLDVERDGLDELAALCAVNGELPATLSVATGGGGLHMYFAMPGFPVRNNAKKLAAHIDIRGTGGQVVAPPSRSGKGTYTVVNRAPIVAAPAWLLDMLRAPATGPVATDSAIIEELPRHDELDAYDRERAERYARTVLDDERQRYIQAPPGSGNDQLFRSAANALEIVQSPWNTLTVGDAYRELDEARLARMACHPYGGGQTTDEFAKTFQSARGQVIGQGRELPADRLDGVMFDPGPGYETPRATDPAGSPSAPAVSLLDMLRAELLTADQVATRPNPRPLVNGLLDLDSEAWLIGKPGTFKSFVALDLAGHVGTGRQWNGRRVHQGTVLYIVAEGVGGMTLRVRAWQKKYGAMDNVLFLPRPVQAANGAGWDALVALAAELKPALVIIDTQARVTVGLKENDATDLGVYVEAVRRLREATTGCVLTIHHIGRNGNDARGSNAIDGAQGTELRLARKDAKGLQVEMVMDKQKDMADSGDPLLINLEPWEDGVDHETGRVISSLVAFAGDAFGPAIQPADPTAVAAADNEDRNENAERVISVLMSVFNEADEFTETEVRQVCFDRYAGMAGWTPGSKRKTFQRAWARLERNGVVEAGSTASRFRYVPVEDRVNSP